jgi:dynein heavy chain
MGSKQGNSAHQMISTAQQKGQWVLIHNCHLDLSWLNQLEQIIDELNNENIHKNFRLILSSKSSKNFPI